jgi:hypothetical protein
VADVWEEESLGDGDVGGVLVVGGVARAFVGVPLATNMGIAALLLVVPLLLLSSPLLVIAPVTVTRNRTFCNKVTGLTTFVTHFLGAGFVVLPPPLFEDLAEALDDERHFLIVELGGVDWLSTWCRLLLLLLRCLECNRLSFERVTSSLKYNKRGEKSFPIFYVCVVSLSPSHANTIFKNN